MYCCSAGRVWFPWVLRQRQFNETPPLAPPTYRLLPPRWMRFYALERPALKHGRGAHGTMAHNSRVADCAKRDSEIHNCRALVVRQRPCACLLARWLRHLVSPACPILCVLQSAVGRGRPVHHGYIAPRGEEWRTRRCCQESRQKQQPICHWILADPSPRTMDRALAGWAPAYYLIRQGCRPLSLLSSLACTRGGQLETLSHLNSSQELPR